MNKKPILLLTDLNGNYGDNSKGKGYTNLLNKEGYMCCLGMVCSQLGIPNDKLLGRENPVDIHVFIPHLTKYSLNNRLLESDLTQEAIFINDNKYTTSKEKEESLITLFKRNGLTIEFTGNYE